MLRSRHAGCGLAVAAVTDADRSPKARVLVAVPAAAALRQTVSVVGKAGPPLPRESRARAETMLRMS